MRRLGWVVFALVLCAVPLMSWLRLTEVGHRPSTRAELPRLGMIPALPLVTQEGVAFDEAKLQGQIRVVDFVFTRCAQICPRVTDALGRVQAALAARKLSSATQLLSISVDPENDTPAALKEFAMKHHADLSNWTFLTGPTAIIDQIVVGGFKQGLDRVIGDGGVNVTHGSRLVLVDRSGAMRGLYDTNDSAEMIKLVDDVEALVRLGGGGDR